MSEQVESKLEAALREAVAGIEMDAANRGWDCAATVFALVPTEELLNTENVPAALREHLHSSWDGSAEHLTAVIQEDLPGTDLEESLAQMAWPDAVVGAAACTERVIIPQEVQAAAPSDPVEAVEFFASHPHRDEVRVIAAVLRGGQTWCALRTRSHDSAEDVATGPDLVPGLLKALSDTFLPWGERPQVEPSGGCGSAGGSQGCCGGGCGCS